MLILPQETGLMLVTATLEIFSHVTCNAQYACTATLPVDLPFIRYGKTKTTCLACGKELGLMSALAARIKYKKFGVFLMRQV